MTFRDYYLKLKGMDRPLHPAKAFIFNISKKTGRRPSTIRQWLCGVQRPPKDVCILLEAELGIPHDELFPDEV